MFLVLNKQKICTYIVSLAIVVILFCATANMNNNKNSGENLVETSSGTSQSKLLPIYNVQTEENKVETIPLCYTLQLSMFYNPCNNEHALERIQF